MKTFYKLCLAAILSMLWLSNAIAQGNNMIHTQLSGPPYPTDTWYLINDGLAPCPATNGIPNGVYDVATSGNIKPLAWSHRRGEVYALIESNNQSCIGWYKFDTVQHKWLRVADDIPAPPSQSKFYTTNGENIFQLFQGRVYQMIEANEYGTYPNGWKEISVAPFSPITESQVWSGGCRPNANDIFEAGARAGAPTAIGDTIFVPFLAKSGCPTENKIGKFSIASGTWTFMTLSGMPWDLYHYGAGSLTFNENYLRAQLEFTFPIAGRFQIFMKIEELYNFGMGNDDSTLAIPSFIWAYDYAEPDPMKKWKNISEGIDYNNATGTANPYGALDVSIAERPRPKSSCIDPVSKLPIASSACNKMWDPPAIYVSFDRKKLYATSGSKMNGGIYYWNGAGWVQQVSDIAEGVRPTNNGLFYKISRYSDNQFYWMDGANNAQVGQINTFCNTDGLLPKDAGFITPDDGKTWYLHYVSNTAGCVNPGNVGGFYRLITNFVDKPAATRNLHLNTGTYLGNTGTNIPIGVGVGSGYRVVVGINSNGGMPQSSTPYAVTDLPGANSLSPGKILTLNARGDSIIRVINVGGQLDELEVQEVAPFNIAVTGDFGLKVLDSTGTSILWQHNLSGIGLPSSGIRHVDISASGQVVVARSGGSYQGKARVFDSAGNLLTNTIAPGRKKLLDVTIKNDTVAVVGENEGKMQNRCFACGDFKDESVNGSTCNNPPSPTDPKNWPIRIPFIHFHAISGTTVNTTPYTKTYDFDANELQPDAADAKITGANFGKDGKLYIVGEHAGPNSVLRWNGKTNYVAWFNSTGQCGPPTPLQQVDAFSRFSVTLNPIVHIGFVGKVNPSTGVVENGTLMYPLNDGNANTLRLRKINTDAKGYIYVGGTSAFRSKGRDLININGNLVGPYSGDATYAMLAPNFRTRMFWGPFNASGSAASGEFAGIGVRENIVALAIKGTKGKFHTTDNAILSNPFNASDPTLSDAYLAVFYQDLWNHSNNDSIQDKAWSSDTLVDPAVLAYKADFDVTSRKICINTPVTFLNKSVGDSILTWDFGAGASLLPGTQGAGPFSVSYSTSGYKTPRLDVLLKNGLSTYDIKHEYIEVLPNNLTLSGSISGPDAVCPGSEAVYSVPATSGITFYDWSFPTGTQILYGAGGPSVRVVFGNSGGTVSVVGQYACGTTAALTKSVSLSAKNENKVIIVGKESSANTVMTFDGTGDYFEATGYTGVSGPGATTALTVEFWLKTSASTLQTVVSWGSTASSEFDVRVDTDGLIRIERGTQMYKSNFAVNDGQWHHVAISIPANSSMNPGTGRAPTVYIDGVVRSYNSHTATGGSHQNVDAGAPVRIGITSRNLSNPFLGELDDVRIWNTNLNAAEILSFFGTTNLSSHPKYANLQYHVHNDVVGATIATDYSGNNYTANRQGNATWVSDPAYQADLALKSKLEAKGFTVQIMKASEISNNGSEASCAGLVYVSSTVVQSTLGQKLRALSVPVIVAQPRSYNDMAMVPAGTANWGGIGSTPQTQVNVTDTSRFSALGANLPGTGVISVYSTPGEVYWGRPLSTSISVAHDNSNPLNKTLFGYETGAVMDGNYAAPARRVGLFLNTYDIAKLQPEYGDSLFNRAICWVLNNCPSPNTITTGTVSPAVYCPGDSITVPFSTTGSFSLTSTVANLPNNQITIDAGEAGASGVTSYGTNTALGDGSINDSYLWYTQGSGGSGSSGSNVAWTVTIPYNGVYEVQYYVPDRTSTLNTNAALRIERPDTSNRTVNFDMNANKGNWVTVATVPFKRGNASVRILNTGTSGSVIVADAVRFVLQSVDASEGNDFVLQLSDNTGNFTSATVIGRLENNNSATSIKGVLPVFLPQGSNYKVRVLSTVPAVTGTVTPTSIEISASQPEPTDPIIGDSIACAGATIQGYKVVDPPSNASGYQWDIPLGASFIGPNDRDTVTIQFNTATTNDISVRKVGNCGLSPEQTLRVTLAGGPPSKPDSIAGRKVVCTSLTSEVYTIDPVPGASSYKWSVHTGAVVVGSVTGNSITVDYTYATQGAGQITVRASNDCGDSEPQVLNVVIDNAATLPVAGTINGLGSLCPNTPDVLYTVAPVAGATNYIWSVSGVGATIDTVTPPYKNQMKLTVGKTDAVISVSVVDACGVSAPSTRVITVGPSPLKRALVITDGDIVTPNAGDSKLKTMLEDEGYTVNFKGNGSVLVADDYCYTVGVVSPSAVDNCNDPGSGGDVTKTRIYRALPIPMIVMNPRTYDIFGIGTSNCGTNTNVTAINIVNASHPLANGLSLGTHTILSSAQNYVWASNTLGTVVANTGTNNQNLIWGIDSGTVVPADTVSDGVATHNLPSYTTKSRIVGWVGLGHHDRSGSNPTANYTDALNATGEALFKRAVCWVTNSCDPIAITLTSINASTFCAGEQISAIFNVSGTIGSGNVFELQLSDASGNFPSSPTVVGTLASNTPGTKTITANLPLSLSTGTGYKVRIRSTSAVSLSNEIAGITINAVPAQASAISGTNVVCPAQTGLIYSVTNVSGVTYNWTLPVGASITSGQGTNSIVANMSGASSGSISVTTSKDGCTNTLARTLPLTFTSANNWTGAVSTAWENPANWSCGFLPTSTSDVTITNVATGRYPVVSTSGAVCRNLVINGSAASVTINSGGTLTLHGNLTRTLGSYTHNSGGTLVMAGSSAQTINMNGSALTINGNLTISNSNGLSLAANTNTTINGTLSFISGKFTIGSNNLTFGASSNITGQGLTRYIVVPDNVSASNFVTRTIPAASSGVVFPIGNASGYAPVTISNNDAAFTAQVRTFSGVYENGKSGSLAVEKAVNRSWEIVPSSYSANLNVKFQWNSTEHLPLFLPEFARVRTNTAPGTWDIHTLSTAASGAGTMEMTANGLTGSNKFPLFSIASVNSALPPLLSNPIMVVGSLSGGQLSMTKADKFIYDSLVARGYDVTVISDLEDAPSTVNSSQFVWISSSVSNSKLGTKYRDVTCPVIINAPVLQNMGLTLAQDGTFGQPGQNATLRNTTHPLSNGVNDLTTPLNSGQNFAAHQANKNFLINNSAKSFVYGMVYDSSGNNRNGVMTFANNVTSDLLVGHWKTDDPAPGRNSAVKMVYAEGRYIELRNYNGPVGTSARSFVGWVKLGNTSGTIVSWGRNANNAGQSITLRMSDNTSTGKLRIDFGDGNNNYVQASTSAGEINDGNWHHVAFTMPSSTTVNGGNIKLYVDGVFIPVTTAGSASINLSTNPQPVRFGRNVTGVGSGKNLEGLIDDVAIWDVELTPSEIATIYNATNGVAAQKSMYPQQANLQFETDFIKVRDAAITPILDRGGAAKIVFAAFEQGGDIASGVAAGKRVIFPYSPNSYSDADGIKGSSAATASFTRILNNTLCWVTNSCNTNVEITTNSVPTTAYCQGDTIDVSFSSSNMFFNSGNVFTVQLSDDNGDFTSPTTIGTLSSTTVPSTPIKCAIPSGTPVGMGYRVRVISSNPTATTVVDNGSNIEVRSSLSAPAAITGPSSVCSGQSGITYTATPVTGATSYTWILPSGATATSISSNELVVDMGTATGGVIRVSASNGTCSSPTKDLVLTINNTNDWVGGSSTSWSEPTNWGCGSVPTRSSNVVIPSTATFMPTVDIVDAEAGNLTINNGGTLSFDVGSALNLYGNLSLSGANAINTSNGTIAFRDTVKQQTMTSTDTVRFNNLTIANPNDVLLLQNARVRGTLNFVRGHLILDAHNIVFTNGSGITGASPERYIITRDVPLFSGSFVIRPVGSSAVWFPVGTPSSFTPARLTNSGTVRPIKVRAFKGVYEWGTSGNALADQIVDRTWEIEPIPYTGHGVNANISLRWNSGEERTNFLPAGAYVRRNKGGVGQVWQNLASGGYYNLGGGIQEITASGVSNFSKFAIFSELTPLPLSLLDFVGYNINDKGELYWRTTNELNVSHFEVEKSVDGYKFEMIGSIEAKGGSAINQYRLTDDKLVQDSYYRLRIVDFDGSVEYSHVVVIKTGKVRSGNFSLYPNPTHNVVTIGYDGTLQSTDVLQVRMFTVHGVELLNSNGSIQAVNGELNRRLANVSQGMYLIHINLNGQLHKFKLVKE